MTETLEAPIHPPSEERVTRESADESSAAIASRSKATMRTKSTTEGSKSSRAPSATKKGKGKSKRNGSVLAAEEVEVEKHSANGSSATAEPLAIEVPAIQSADDQEPQSSPSAAESQQESTTRRRGPGLGAVRSWVRSNLLSSCLAVVLVVAVVFLALTQLNLNSQNSLNSARTSALGSARSYAADLATYNYKTLNQDFGKVLAESTPSFKQNFTQSSTALKTAIVKYDASASANVVGAGLVSATSSRAVVLVFLNQTVKNTLQKNDPTTESRVEITLVRSGGRWLIEQVSLL